MMNSLRTPTNPGRRRLAGRYALLGKIGAGGMGSVYLGRLIAAAGFERTVAVKRVNSDLVADADALAMFRQEVRLAARIQHPNVPSALDVVEDGDEIWLVMEYVHGPGLPLLLQNASGAYGIPAPIAAAIAIGMLNGLHAAHEATDSDGNPLEIVHRDVSPQNVLVGCDGLARIIDFGIARATGQLQSTMIGQIKGKLAYLAPERLTGTELDRRADVFSAAIVLWEMLTGKKLFETNLQAHIIERALSSTIVAPSSLVPGLSPALDAVVLRGLEKEPSARFQTAREMALALSSGCEVASPHELADWVSVTAARFLEQRNAQLAEADALKLTPFPVDEAPASKTPAVRRPQFAVEEQTDRTVFAPIQPLKQDPRAPAKPSSVRPIVYTQPDIPLPLLRTTAKPSVRGALAGTPTSVLVRRGAMIVATCVLLGFFAASQLGRAASGVPASGAPVPSAVRVSPSAIPPEAIAPRAPAPGTGSASRAQAPATSASPALSPTSAPARKRVTPPVTPPRRPLASPVAAAHNKTKRGIDGF